MSSFGSKQIKGSNCNELLPNPDGSLNVSVIPGRKGFNPYIWKPLETPGPSIEMDVDGSVTPVLFSFIPGAGETFNISGISLVLIHKGKMQPPRFGSIAGGLANGLELEVQLNGVASDILALFDNLDIATHFKSDPSITGDESQGFLDSVDVYRGTLTFDIPMTITGDTSDFIRWSVQDNLTALDSLRSSVKMQVI